MNITPDHAVYWRFGFAVLNRTIVSTWAVMALLVISSWLVTRRLEPGPDISRRQMLLESLVELVRGQVASVLGPNPDRFIPMLGSLLLFIGVSNILGVLPGFDPPTASLSTTIALALAVFAAVPFYGVSEIGLAAYLKNYVQPSIVMLPFNVIGELSRTLALAVRLFGNMMSGKMIIAILLTVIPLFFPIVMQLFGLLTGVVQAFIFFILAAVYIGANRQARERKATGG